MSRLTRISGSLAIVMVVYWTYSLTAVPLIEPRADPREDQELSGSDLSALDSSIDQRLAELEGLFPPGSWQLQNPKILENGQAKLLFRDYRSLGEGRVELHPCAVVLIPSGPAADEADRKRRAVILDAPEGAVLQFDRPLELGRAEIGHLTGGQLKGRITIHSQGKLPGPEDDLEITTQNVELSERHVWTPHPVDFRLGPNYGRGQEMHINLLPAEEGQPSEQPGLSIGGLESFELRHLQRLHLESSKPQALPGAKLRPGQLPSGTSAELACEVTCRGPFRFDMGRRAATFQDQVNVLRINPAGPGDQVTCEMLTVHFSQRRKAAGQGGGGSGRPDDKQGPDLLDLEARRIEAQGDPVVVSAPSQQAQARGQRLEYDLWTGRILLEGTGDVWLKQGPNEIHAPSLQYQPTEPGRIGLVAAQGPGWLCGQMAERPQQQLEARWNDQLRVRPQEQNQLISLTGGAELKFQQLGQLGAREIHFWLIESPQAGSSTASRLQPDRMLALGDVRIESTQLSAAVDRLEGWFEQQGKLDGRAAKAERRVTLRLPAVDSQWVGPGQSTALEQLLPPATLYPVANAQPVDSSPAAVPAAPGDVLPRLLAGQSPAKQHFEILGRLMRVRLAIQDQQTELAELTVEDGVRFSETRTAQPNQRPLRVAGDRLHAVDPSQPHGTITVAGRQAHFEGRGLELNGPNINLNRGTNRLWVDGPGQMGLPLGRDLEGRPVSDAGMLDVRWHQRMTFDGRTAQFEDSVTAVAPQGQMQTETLEVRLKQAVRFSDQATQPPPAEVEQILCRGGVRMENTSFEGQTPSSLQRMQVADLVINMTTGELTAAGPGWLTRVACGSADPLSAPAGPGRLASRTAQPDASVDHGLRGLLVRFQGRITGNVHYRELTFHDRVQAAYAPVEAWEFTLDPDRPETLGPRGAALACNQLTVREIPTPLDGRRAREMMALGNVVVESQTWTARAVRMSYAEAKDLVTLEGDGRTLAELSQQQQLGGPRKTTAAGRIFYWPKTDRVIFDGARSFESN